MGTKIDYRSENNLTHLYISTHIHTVYIRYVCMYIYIYSIKFSYRVDEFKI